MVHGSQQDEKGEKKSFQAGEIARVKARDAQGIAGGLAWLKHVVCTGKQQGIKLEKQTEVSLGRA